MAASTSVASLPDRLSVTACRSVKRGGGLRLAHNTHTSLSLKRCHVMQTKTQRTASVRCSASNPDLEEQFKLMAAAEKRWQSQVTEGKVKPMSPKEAGYALQLNGHVLLDVRPSNERQKSWVKNSVWSPAFEAENGVMPGTLLDRFTHFAFGGWWSGAPLTRRNERFMPDIAAQIPKGANIIVACQKGMRSLAACEQLYKAGYKNLFWLSGGFDAAEEGDFERDGPQPLKFAGIGGVSEFLGWTDIQRAQAAKEGLSYRLQQFVRLVAVIVIADVSFVGLQQLYKVLHSE